VAFGFFLLWFFVNLPRLNVPLWAAVVVLVLLTAAFYAVSFLALRPQCRWSVLFSLLSALIWSATTILASAAVLVAIFGLPFH